MKPLRSNIQSELCHLNHVERVYGALVFAAPGGWNSEASRSDMCMKQYNFNYVRIMIKILTRIVWQILVCHEISPLHNIFFPLVDKLITVMLLFCTSLV